MAKAIMNCRIYLAEVDLSGVANAAALNMKADIVECTAFSDTMKDKKGGLTDVICDVSGYFSAEAVTGNPDHKMFDQLSLANAVLTLASGAGAFGEKAWFFKPTLSQYTPLEGKVSEMATFKLHGEGAAPLVRGRVLAANASRGVTGAGTKYNLGAYSATQRLYAALHVLSASPGGDTLDVTIAIADRINTVTINAGGTGYSEDDVLTVVQSGGSLATVTVTSVGAGGEVIGISLTTPGSGYTVANGLSTTGGGGTGAKVNITAIVDTTVISFTQKTAVGHEWVYDQGPITDVNFKAKWTIGGADPSFSFAVVAGIV